MTRMQWGATGSRFFETGLDRGVFFLGNGPGRPWPGLTSVSEGSGSAAARPYYLDGMKYLNLSTAEDFQATVESFFAPEGFEVCDGSYSLSNGLFATQQPKKSFGFSYRTLLGNDTDMTDHAYKIHLIYNALASAGAKQRVTLKDTIEPARLTWNITTLPPIITGFRPTAHFVVDSRQSDPQTLSDFEDILYGSEAGDSRMPDVPELIAIFGG